MRDDRSASLAAPGFAEPVIGPANSGRTRSLTGLLLYCSK